MAFWSEANLDPKRKFRWVVQIAGLGIGEYVAKTVDKPKFEISEEEHKFINHTFYYPGRVTWQEISMTLVDPGGQDDVTKALVGMLRNSGYDYPNDIEAAKASITKAGATAALGRVEISQIDAEGAPVESWVLHNAWLKNVEFGELTYEDEGLVEVTMTVRYDWATVE